MAEKRCGKCGETKPLEAFNRQRDKADGRQSRCKACSLKAQQTPQARAYMSEYVRRPNTRRLNAEARFLREYGIDYEDWARMYERQGGVCAGCREVLRHDKSTHVDHCHATGKVRGLLCDLCNVALGSARESPAVLHGLIAYLEAHRADPI